MQTTVLSEMAVQRTGCATTLLAPAEHAALSAALDFEEPTLRACAFMAAAAALSDCGQAHFWTHLPATLASHVPTITERMTTGSAAKASPLRVGALQRRSSVLAAHGGGLLYANDAIVDEAQRRMNWHEAAHGGSFGTGEFEAVEEDGEVARLYDARILENVCIGDYEMAVGLSMATPPLRSLAFYRNSLLTVAASSATRFQRGRGMPPPAAAGAAAAVPPAEQFATQALKVVAEHSRAIGDVVTGVVLLTSAGLFQEAVAQLQASNDWHRAVTLSAHTLTAPTRNALLHAWALLLARGAAGAQRTWHVAGLLVAAGSLRAAAAAMRHSGAHMQALALAEAAQRLGAVETVTPGAPANTGALTAGLTGGLEDIAETGELDTEATSEMTIEQHPTLTAKDLAMHMGDAMPLTPTESECAEIGTHELSNELSSNIARAQAGSPAAAPAPVPSGAKGPGEREKAVEMEVLVNLHAPAAAVLEDDGAAADGDGDAEGLLPLGDVVTGADQLEAMRAAARRHVIDVLSEALASQKWL